MKNHKSPPTLNTKTFKATKSMISPLQLTKTKSMATLPQGLKVKSL